MSEADPWDLVIGRLGPPYGLHGEIRVEPETDFPERFGRLQAVLVQFPDGTSCTLQVAASRVGPQRITLRFVGYDTPEQVKALTGGLLTIRRSQAVPLPAGHYYQHQIVGLQVQDPAGRPLGRVSEVLRTGANDVYVADGLLIPATRQVVKRIDLEQGVMVVDLPPEA